MSVLRGILVEVWGLVVEDGWIAAGTMAALGITGAWALGFSGNLALREAAGWLLLVLLMLLLLTNLHSAGRQARRQNQD